MDKSEKSIALHIGEFRMNAAIIKCKQLFCLTHLSLNIFPLTFCAERPKYDAIWKMNKHNIVK